MTISTAKLNTGVYKTKKHVAQSNYNMFPALNQSGRSPWKHVPPSISHTQNGGSSEAEVRVLGTFA